MGLKEITYELTGKETDTDIEKIINSIEPWETIRLMGSALSHPKKLAEHVAKIISKSCVTDLRLWYLDIGEEEGLEVYEALKTNTTITTLEISPTIAKCVRIAEVIKFNTTITKLRLDCDHLPDNYFTEFEKAIKSNYSITKLSPLHPLSPKILAVYSLPPDTQFDDNEDKEVYRYIEHNKDCTKALADFIKNEYNLTEFAKSWEGKIDSLMMVKEVTELNDGFSLPKGIYSYFALLPKVNKPFLRECLNIEQDKFGKIMDNIANFIAANFFKLGVIGEAFNVLPIPIEIITKITKYLPSSLEYEKIMETTSSIVEIIEGSNHVGLAVGLHQEDNYTPNPNYFRQLLANQLGDNRD